MIYAALCARNPLAHHSHLLFIDLRTACNHRQEHFITKITAYNRQKTNNQDLFKLNLGLNYFFKAFLF